MKTIAIFDMKNYNNNMKHYKREAVRAVIVKDGKAAFVRSAIEGFYKIPGGGIEEGENHINTLIRETREETGLVVKPNSIREMGKIIEIRKSANNDDEVFEQISYCYYAEVEDLQLSQELSENETKLQFTLVWEDPLTVYLTNTSLANDYTRTFLFREAYIAKYILGYNKPIEEACSYGIVKKERINKGWSSDTKYCIVSEDGTKYLLRIAPIEKMINCEKIFAIQQKLAALGLAISQPLEIGKCDEGNYTIKSWIDGKDAEEIIPTLDEKTQYAYGKMAGITLKKIHSMPAPSTQIDWETRFNAKIDRKIKAYNECPIKFTGAEKLIDYIENHRVLLANRPQCFQHGDYHIGNMMIENKKLIIIDFDRFDFGDPWEEFNRIVWSAGAAPKFACGMIDGYFDDNVPILFWQLLALYISSNMLSSLPWAIPFGEAEITTMKKQACDILNWYDNMQRIIPKWYSK